MAGLAARLYRCAIASHRRLAKQQGAEAVGLFDVIHSLDRPKLAAALARAMAESGRNPRLFVQVNTGDEPQKAGVPVGDVAGFVSDCRTQHGLRIEGLMCLPPVGDAAARILRCSGNWRHRLIWRV